MKKILFILLLTTPFIGFGQGLIGYYVDDQTDQLWKTTDGGVTFNVVNSDLVYTPSSVEFIDENITSVFDITILSSKRELIKTTNILGQENTTIKNQLLIEIYDDGSTEKKIVLE